MRDHYWCPLVCAVLLLPNLVWADQEVKRDSMSAASELIALKSTDGRRHEIESIALGRSENGDIVYLVERTSEQLSKEHMHPDIDCLFWQLDTKGHVLHKEFIAKMPSLEPPRVTIIPLPAPQEGAIIIGAFEDNFGWSLLRVDNTGRVVKSTKLVNEPAAFLSAVLLPNAKGILLVGQYGFQGSVWKIDLDGKVSWRKTYEYKAKADDKKEKAGDDEAKARKKTNTAFYGLALTDDQGDFIVAGDHGDIEKLGLGPRSVWLVCCDAEGVVASEEAFPGRYPSICAVDGNRFAVLYGAQTEMSIDSHVRVVDIQLKQQWDKKVELTSVWVDRPAISNIPSRNGFVVAGCNLIAAAKKKMAQHECRFFQYDTNGQIVNTASIPIAQSTFLHTRVVCGSDNAYVAVQTMGSSPMERGEAAIFKIPLRIQNP